MLLGIRNFLKSALTTGDGVNGAPDREHALKVATAALLVELSRADFESTAVEREMIANLIREHFELSAAEADKILNVADDEAERAVSLHDFTRLLHDTLEPREKHEVIEMLWRVAYADTRLDKYEDHFVRKVADLLYVSHQDLVRIRHKVKGGK